MKVSTSAIRLCFGKVLKILTKRKKTFVIENDSKPVAGLISTEMSEQRFVDKQEQEKHKKILDLICTSGAKAEKDSLTTIRELRYGRNQ